ncbi:MAG: serine/threonine-protein kinase [Gemmataceae bacterium]
MPPAADVADDEPAPRSLGGYQIVRELGRGGMGTVYLARQVSLDRPVALKVMRRRWAQNPAFVVRFTREAYAAAQLVHHNIVQVYDVGSDQGWNYISLEYVEGSSLAQVLEKQGRIDPAEAAGYALQAARGLQFAHERGMVHRDVKPSNLLLNRQGVVKVADLGLVRTPGQDEPSVAAEAEPGVAAGSLASLGHVTPVRRAVGTPAYMAPEQARDSTRVDPRADVYSLGCTLYALLVGRPPFGGGAAQEVAARHRTEPVTPPDRVVPQVPADLSAIVVTMLAKRPEDRPASMAEVIAALERVLGVQGQREQEQLAPHAQAVEANARAFREAPTAKLRSTILFLFFGACAALPLLLVLLGAWRLAFAAGGFGLLTAIAYFVLHGLTHRSPLFERVRDLLLTTSRGDRVVVAIVALLFLAALYLGGQLGVWALGGLIGVGLATAMHFLVDTRLLDERDEPLENTRALLKPLRLRGVGETVLQDFVCRHAGEQWEEFFEALFGYDAKMQARRRLGGDPLAGRPRYAAWRDPIISWVDATLRARREARERRHLQAVEQSGLLGDGMTADAAKREAEARAAELVRKAAEAKQAEQGGKGPPRRVNVQEMVELPTAPIRRPLRIGRAVESVLDTVFGGAVRFIVGAMLLAVSLFWLHANGRLPTMENYADPAIYQAVWEQQGQLKPLDWPLPPPVNTALGSLNAGFAGLALLLSVRWLSWKIGVLTLAGAAIMVAGPVSGFVPDGASWDARLVCLAAGGIVMLAGFLFGRDT